MVEFKFALIGDVDESYLPSRATEADTGWDVKAALSVEFQPFETRLVPLGIRVFSPPGWWLELRSRSSTHFKKNLIGLYGVIDEAFENQIQFCCTYVPPHGQYSPPLVIPKGERIAQLVPVQRPNTSVSLITDEEYTALCSERNAQRGLGGFGSTGR